MPDCPISLKGDISTAPPKETWYIEPRPFNPSGKCTVKITVSDPRVGATKTPITGTGDFGGIHVSGADIQNGAIVIEPPPPKDVRIEWDVTCPDCTKHLVRDFRHKPSALDYLIALLLFLASVAGGGLVGFFLGGLIGAAIGAFIGELIGGALAAWWLL